MCVTGSPEFRVLEDLMSHCYGNTLHFLQLQHEADLPHPPVGRAEPCGGAEPSSGGHVVDPEGQDTSAGVEFTIPQKHTLW